MIKENPKWTVLNKLCSEIERKQLEAEELRREIDLEDEGQQ